MICTTCGGKVVFDEGSHVCGDCRRAFPVRDGILSFCPDDDFYEGRFGAEGTWKPRAPWKRHLLDLHLSIYGQRSRFLGKHLCHPSCILDLGCGGGNEQLKGAGSYVVGVDVSRAALWRAMQIYDEVYQANAVALPFEDGSFDTVVCLDMFGHLPIAQKAAALGEMYRVLRPQATMIHLVEVDATGGLFRYAKRHPDLYQKYFIDLDGHHGLESPAAVVQRYATMGFSVQDVRHFAKVCWSPGEYAKRFGNEYSRRSRLLRLLAGLDRRLAVGGWRTAATAILLQGASLVVEPLLPTSYCGLLGLYCAKR